MVLIEHCFVVMDYAESFIFKSFKYVIPYYIVDERGDKNKHHHGHSFDAGDIGIVFAAFAIGSLIGSQIPNVSHCFKSSKLLFIGAHFQILCALIGYLFVSLVEYNGNWFILANFSIGIAFCSGTHKAILKIYALNDIDMERHLMIHRGIHHYIAELITSILAPILYQIGSFHIYAYFQATICVIDLCVLFYVSKHIQNKLRLHHKAMEKQKMLEKELFATQKSHRLSEAVSIGLSGWMNSSLVVLILSVIVWSFTNKLYDICMSIILAEKYGIQAVIGGVAHAVATILAVIITQLAISRQLLKYPYDMMTFYLIFGITTAIMALVSQKWVIYSFHIMAICANHIICTIELVARLYLVPSHLFNQVTSINSALVATNFFAASMSAGPILDVNDDLTFYICSSLSFIIIVIIFAIHSARKQYLKNHSTLIGIEKDENNERIPHLVKERAYIVSRRRLTQRRGAMSVHNISSTRSFHNSMQEHSLQFDQGELRNALTSAKDVELELGRLSTILSMVSGLPFVASTGQSENITNCTSKPIESIHEDDEYKKCDVVSSDDASSLSLTSLTGSMDTDIQQYHVKYTSNRNRQSALLDSDDVT